MSAAEIKFMECAECAPRPGSPLLCEACLNNRQLESERDDLADRLVAPVRLLLWCPGCKCRHIDVGEFATRPHHTHACQTCGMVWRPGVVPTVGVEFLPGFKDQP
jgi:hypothetical protein